MIDLHCHLHYGCDDGPHNPQESVALARALRDAGVTKVACTSHLRRDKDWVNDASVQAALHAKLDAALLEGDVSLERVQGAEHYIDELLLETCEKEQVVPFSGTKWLLIELPYHGPPPNLMQFLYQVRCLGYKILLAHLERFAYVAKREDLLEQIITAGYAIQVNLGSLSGQYHRDHKKLAEMLVIEGYANVAGGDCHRDKDVRGCIEKGRHALRKLVGEEGEQTLLVENPGLILADAEPEDLVF